MHSTRFRAFAFGGVAALVLLAAISCRRNTTDGHGDGPNAGAFDKAALLRAFGQCAVGTYKDFQTALGGLAEATRRAESEGTPESRKAAQEAWNTAIDAWQRAEHFGFGPAGPGGKNGTPGGKDLRDAIYGWPLVSPCQIDQGLVSQDYDKPQRTSGLPARTLAAVEYLLFYEGVDNACGPEGTINVQGTWKAILPQEIQKRRMAYARAAVADVVVRTRELVEAWDPTKGNFVEVLASAGRNDIYKTQQMGFNAVSDAVFFIDIPVKNMKVGRPLGLTSDRACSAPPCVDLVESPFAHRSKEHIRNDLVGFENLMRGCGPNHDGLGFDDLLVAVGAEATARRLADATASVVAALAALREPTFEDELRRNPAGVKKLFEALRALVGTMKTEMASVLDLELPQQVIGDND